MSKPPLFPRKTPKQRRAEATVGAVIEAAARILETSGLEGYNTNAIAKSAGISVGSLYQYFPNKDAITRALVEREASSLISEFEMIAADSERMKVIGRVVSAVVDHLMTRPNLARILDIEEQRLALQHDVAESEKRVGALLATCLFRDEYASLQEVPVALPDIIAIIRGMADGAGSRGALNSPDLAERVECAVLGYMGRMARKLNPHSAAGSCAV